MITANRPESFNLDVTDEEFVALHAAASAEGLEVNDFIVATLRKHAEILREVQAGRNQHGGTMTGILEAVG